MQKKILFISHSAERTGAPLMLLNLLTWLKDYTDLSFEILLRDPGPLMEKFATIAPTLAYSDQKAFPDVSPRLWWRFWPKKQVELQPYQELLDHYRRSNIGVIYSNTITNGTILEALAPLARPVITHVHELDYWIERAGKENLTQILSFSNHYIAASNAVKTNLVKKYAIQQEKIDVVHSFIPAKEVNANPAGIRKELDIPEKAFVVLGSGHETWRKGKDLFIQLAALTQKTLPENQVHFLWVGGWGCQEDERNAKHDVDKIGLSGRIHFIGEVTNPNDYFAIGNVFAMVSREDPFPLVCLEAAALEKPVLCFAQSGGMPEFVEDDAGIILPYLDLQAMASSIAKLAKEPELLDKLGRSAAKKVCERHDVEEGSRQIHEIIKKYSSCLVTS